MILLGAVAGGGEGGYGTIRTRLGSGWRMSGTRTRVSTAAVIAAAFTLSGCSTIGGLFSSSSDVPVGQVGNVPGFLGGVVADEPEAALAGRKVLSAGGTAADAATAMGFALAVTLPSRAGLGSSGGCLVYNPTQSGPGGGVPEAIMFPATAPSAPGSADRPASVPMLARGLFAMQARYGSRPIETLIVPAEQMARFGVPVSRALLRDLAVVAGPLSVDPGAKAVFFPTGAPLVEGATLLQPELGGTIAQMRQAGVGDLYQGMIAKRLEAAMPFVGGGLTVADMRGALPHFETPLQMPAPNNEVVATLPPPEAGGMATMAALQVLVKNLNATEAAGQRALGAAAAFRRGGANAEAVLAGSDVASSIGALPASTTFGALDQNGGAVMCAVSMGNLFGTGRIAPGTGVLMAVSPARAPQPLLSVAMLYSPAGFAFHGMAGGSGQDGAPLAAAVGLVNGMRGKMPVAPPEPGRANVIVCPGYLPGNAASCAMSTDPRGFGLAAGSN